MKPFTRRRFLESTLTTGSLAWLSSNRSVFPQVDDEEPKLTDRIFKTLKIGMVKTRGTLTEKFRAAKEAGFAGIELNSPRLDIQQARRATEESGLPIDGTVISSHWNIRHSSADADERATALKHLKDAIRNTHAIGGNTTLLVVGKGSDGTEEEVWNRSFENIVQALPVAARYGIHIAIENVWNQFLYDHDGGADQTAEKYIKYVDQFESPWVGMQFDIGNHWKYGSMGDWIRALDHRVIKLDLKGYHRGKQAWSHIGAGDIDWADVRKALVEINFHGWAAAEVGGGDQDRLIEISGNMDRVFNL